MSARLVLLGAGGHASDVLTAVETSSTEVEVWVADDAEVPTARFEGRARLVEGSIDAALALDATFLSAIGYPRTRAAVVARADRAGVAWSAAIVHADATVHRSVSLGSDCVVLGRTWLSAHVEVGDHSNIGYGVTVGHDTRLDRFAAVMPGANIGGEIAIGEHVLIGANATVLQGLRIGDGATVGAGAVVTKDVPAGHTVVGVPAREVGS